MKKNASAGCEKSPKRGDEKKLSILMAALKLFGEYGLKATSVRMIADKAGANSAAIAYYYTSKENLYLEVMHYITEQIRSRTQENRTRFQSLIESNKLSKKQAQTMLRKIKHSMAVLIVEHEESKAWAQIIMREQANPTEAFNILYDGLMKHMQKISIHCLAVCMDLDPNSKEAKIRTHALIGQMLGFLVNQESLLRILNVKQLSQDELTLIYQVLDSHVMGCLKAPLSPDVI